MSPPSPAAPGGVEADALSRHVPGRGGTERRGNGAAFGHLGLHLAFISMENRNTTAQAAGAQSAVRERATSRRLLSNSLNQPLIARHGRTLISFPWGTFSESATFSRRCSARSSGPITPAPLSVVLFRFEARKLNALGGVEAHYCGSFTTANERQIFSVVCVRTWLPCSFRIRMSRKWKRSCGKSNRASSDFVRRRSRERIPHSSSLNCWRSQTRLPWFVVSNLKHQNENGYRLKRTLDIAGAIAGSSYFLR